jgi:hypothetical protein
MSSLHQETMGFLGQLQRQHDHALHMLYTTRLRNEDLGDIARDPEVLYHVEATEAITAYLEQQ